MGALVEGTVPMGWVGCIDENGMNKIVAGGEGVRWCFIVD